MVLFLLAITIFGASDLVMFQGNFEVKDIEIVGNSQKDRTISGLWPSDHAGIVASLNLNGDKY
jgi:hypothetical protein